MLLRPMLFIDIITICSYCTCTTNMLVKIHKRKFGEKKKQYDKCKGKRDLVLQFYYITCKQLERNKNNATVAKGKNLKYTILYA
jgi:hypothetical protein